MNSVDSHATVARHVKTAVLAVCTRRGGRMCMYHGGNQGNKTRAYTYDAYYVRQGQKPRGGAGWMGDASGGRRGNGRKRPPRRCSGGGRWQGARQTGTTREGRRGGSPCRSNGMRRGGRSRMEGQRGVRGGGGSGQPGGSETAVRVRGDEGLMTRYVAQRTVIPRL